MTRSKFFAATASGVAALGQTGEKSANRYRFAGGRHGAWAVTRMSAYRGEGLAKVERLSVLTGDSAATEAQWVLEGFTSNVRYATKEEVARLKAEQPALARPEATCAALIPIRKSAAWWALAQDERRAIFEESSHHTAIGLEYLPAIARRLHHARDLGGPFDFLTWFEFAPEHRETFDELLARLRATPEWKYVEREVEIHLAAG